MCKVSPLIPVKRPLLIFDYSVVFVLSPVGMRQERNRLVKLMMSDPNKAGLKP